MKKRIHRKKATLNLGGILNDMRHIYHERRNQGNIWPGEENSLLNHMHDVATATSRLKDQCLIGSSATMSNLASLHGHTQRARREKPASQEYSFQKSCRSEMTEKLKTVLDKANLMKFITTSPTS